MKLTSRTIVSSVCWLAIVPAAHLTLSANLEARIYPVNADSIGIPLMEAVINTIALVLCLIAAAGLASLARTRGRKAKVVIHELAAFIGLLTATLAALLAASWAIPHHYAMASAYVPVIIAALVFAYQDASVLWVKD